MKYQECQMYYRVTEYLQFIDALSDYGHLSDARLMFI